MKRCLLLFTLIICLLQPDTSIAQKLYVRYFDKPPNIGAYLNRLSIIRLQDDNTLVLSINGNPYISGNDSPFAVTTIFLNKNGLPFQSKQYKCNYWTEDYIAASSVQDGGFIFATALLDTTGINKYVGYLAARCDKKGNLLWAKQIETNLTPSVKPIIIKETPDGGCIIESYFDFYIPPFGNKVHLVWLDKEGNMKQHFAINTFTEKDDNYDAFYIPTSLAFTNKGGLLLGGNKRCEICEGYGDLSASVIKLDSNKQIVYSKNVKYQPDKLEILNTVKVFDSANYTLAVGGNFKVTFADTNTQANGFYIPNFDGYWRKFLKTHPGQLPFRLDTYAYGYYDTDLSYTGWGRANGSDPYKAYDYVYRQDSLGRKCPDYKPIKGKTSSTQYLYYLLDKSATGAFIKTQVKDIALIEADYHFYSTLYCTDVLVADSNQ